MKYYVTRSEQIIQQTTDGCCEFPGRVKRNRFKM